MSFFDREACRKMNFYEFITELMCRWSDLFDVDSDGLWQEWCKSVSGLKNEAKARRLVVLLKSDVNMGFKARAALALMAPLPSDLSEDHIGDWKYIRLFDDNRGIVHGFAIGMPELTTIRPFIADMIASFLWYVSEHQTSFQCGWGVAYLIPRYNRFLMRVMALDSRLADDSLEYLELNDHVCWNQELFDSGVCTCRDLETNYQAFWMLMRNIHLSREIRRAADERMHNILLTELQERKDDEDTKCLVRIYLSGVAESARRLMNCGPGWNDQRRLVAEQLYFAMCLPGAHKLGLDAVRFLEEYRQYSRFEETWLIFLIDHGWEIETEADEACLIEMVVAFGFSEDFKHRLANLCSNYRCRRMQGLRNCDTQRALLEAMKT